MPRPPKADRRAVASDFITFRTTETLFAAIDAATARVAQTRGKPLTRTQFIHEAILRAIHEAGVELADPGAPSLPFPSSASPSSGPTQRPLPGLDKSAGGVDILRHRPARSPAR